MNSPTRTAPLALPLGSGARRIDPALESGTHAFVDLGSEPVAVRSPFTEGARLLGRYDLQACLGQGGMASVWRARDREDGRLVAIKAPHPSLAQDPTALARFDREARIGLLRLHPGLPFVHEIAVTSCGRRFLVMEFVQGPTLTQLLDRGVSVSSALAIRTGRQILAALQALHVHRIVHRDMKADNVILMPEAPRPGQAMRFQAHVIDLGIAGVRGVDTGEPDLTPAGWSMTGLYHATPEQLAGERGDHRVDVYAAGVLLYMMLSGRAPFAGENVAEICRRTREEKPAPLRAYRQDVPGPLEAAVMRALDKDPERRFESATAMSDALLPRP